MMHSVIPIEHIKAQAARAAVLSSKSLDANPYPEESPAHAVWHSEFLEWYAMKNLPLIKPRGVVELNNLS